MTCPSGAAVRGVADIFAEFAQPGAAGHVEPAPDDDLYQAMLTALNGVLKKSECTRLKWSQKFAALALEVDSALARRLKPDLLVTLNRCGETAESNLQVWENFLEGFIALLQPFTAAETVEVLATLLLFKFAPSQSVRRSAERALLAVCSTEQDAAPTTDSGLMITQKQYRGLVKLIVEKLRRKLTEAPALAENAPAYARLLMALSQCIRHLVAKSNLGDVLEDLHVFSHFVSQTELPDDLKTAGIDVCRSVLVYCDVNGLPVPARLVKQATKLFDTESQTVTVQRLKLTRSIMRNATARDLLTPLQHDDIMRKTFQICVAACGMRNGEIIDCAFDSVFQPQLTSLSDRPVSAHWIQPLPKALPQIPLSHAVSLLLLRCLFLGVPANRCRFDEHRRIVRAADALAEPKRRSRIRSDIYFETVWRNLAKVCNSQSALTMLEVWEDKRSDDSLDLTPRLLGFYAGSLAVVRRAFIDPVIEAGILTEAAIRKRLPLASEIVIAFDLESQDNGVRLAALNRHFLNVQTIQPDDFAIPIVLNAEKGGLAIDLPTGAMLLDKIRISTQLSLAQRVSLLASMELTDELRTPEEHAAAVLRTAEHRDSQKAVGQLSPSVETLEALLADQSTSASAAATRLLQALAKVFDSHALTVAVLKTTANASEWPHSDLLQPWLTPAVLLDDSLSLEQRRSLITYISTHLSLYDASCSTTTNALRVAIKEMMRRSDYDQLIAPTANVLHSLHPGWWEEEMFKCKEAPLMRKLASLAPRSDDSTTSPNIEREVLLAYYGGRSPKASPASIYFWIQRQVEYAREDDDHLLLLLEAVVSVLEDESIETDKTPSEIAINHHPTLAASLASYLQFRFTVHAPVPLSQALKALDSRNKITVITGCLAVLQLGLWKEYQNLLICTIDPLCRKQEERFPSLLATNLLCYSLIPALEGHLTPKSPLKEFADFFGVALTIWRMLESQKLVVAQGLLLSIASVSIQILWSLLSKKRNEDIHVSLDNVALFTRTVVGSTVRHSVGNVSESVVHYLESYKIVELPLGIPARRRVIQALSEAVNNSLPADRTNETVDEFNSHYWLAVMTIFGREVAEILIDAVVGESTPLDDVRLQIINSLVLPTLQLRMDEEFPDAPTVFSPLVNDVVKHLDPMGILCQNILTTTGSVHLDPAVLTELVIGGLIKELPQRRGSMLDHVLVSALTDRRGPQERGPASELIELMAMYSPLTLSQCSLSSKACKSTLNLLVERFGHKAYKLRVKDQVVVINRLMTRSGLLAHYDAGSVHIRIWDNPDYQEASVDIDVLVDLSNSIPLTLPKVVMESEVKGFAEPARFRFMQILKSLGSSAMLFGDYTGGGGQNLVFATAKIADQFHANFRELEDCVICYMRLHRESKTAPDKCCTCCSNNFHGECLQKWFITSHNTRCPMCRTIFI